MSKDVDRHPESGYAWIPAAEGGGIVHEGKQLANSPMLKVLRASSELIPRLPHAWSSRLLSLLQAKGGPPAGARSGLEVDQEKSAGVTTWHLTPSTAPRGTVVFLHGGGYVQGPDAGQWRWLAKICHGVGVAAAAILYRMPPAHPFPQALEDAVAAITAMETAGRLKAGTWVLAGDSAGGGLALATAQALIERDGPRPAGLLLTAPWVDLALDDAKQRTRDPMMSASFLRWCTALYSDGHPVSDPRLSPLYGEMHGLPPVHLNVGTEDLLQPDVNRLKEALDAASIPVTFIEQQGGVHTYPQLGGAAADWTVRDQIRWVNDLLAVPQDRS